MIHLELSEPEAKRLKEILACVAEEFPGGLYSKWANDFLDKLTKKGAKP